MQSGIKRAWTYGVAVSLEFLHDLDAIDRCLACVVEDVDSDETHEKSLVSSVSPFTFRYVVGITLIINWHKALTESDIVRR